MPAQWFWRTGRTSVAKKGAAAGPEVAANWRMKVTSCRICSDVRISPQPIIGVTR